MANPNLKRKIEIRKYGLIGYPLSHSFSKRYFTKKFINEDLQNASYGLYPLKNEKEVGRYLETTDFSGLNVTIPYKQTVIPYLDYVHPIAKQVKAVNVIKNVGGKLHGYNTDVLGIEHTLNQILAHQKHSKALILGTGGSARSVQYVLAKNDIKQAFVSRSSEKGDFTYTSLTGEIIKMHTLIINTTPVGMWPLEIDRPAIPYDSISSKHSLFDLIYNPEKTLFLTSGEEKGARTFNGLPMLIKQAEESWVIWTSPDY